MALQLSQTLTLRQGPSITDQEFAQLRTLVYDLTGIFIDEKKKYLFENRFAKRLKELNLRSFTEYYSYLKYEPRRKDEYNVLYELITTNETSFYRDLPQLTAFQTKVLPEILDAQRKAGKKELHIWSAGCSSGEEPYTLAIMLCEVLRMEIAGWKVRITANDLSPEMLKLARAGLYREYALRTTPKEIVARYFTKEGDFYKIKPQLARLVVFDQINLNDRDALKRVPRSQIVFCRNVIIYFDQAMKQKVVGSFYDNLLPEGYLIIGHSESLHGISRAFKPFHHPGAIVYKKA